MCICQARRQTALGEAAEESAEMHARRQEGSVSTCGVWHNRRTGSGSAVSQTRKQCPHSATSGCCYQGVQSKSVHSSLCVLVLWWAYLSLREHRQVHSAVLLDVVVCKGAFVLEKRPPCEDETLLVGWDALLVLDHRLHVLDSVIGGHIQRSEYTILFFHEDLYAVFL